MSQPAPSIPKVLLFDVNQTLLDLTEVEAGVERVLGEPGAAQLWFATMLQYALVLTVSGQYRPFPEIGAAALQMLAGNRNISLSETDARATLAPMTRAPAHADVPAALARLREAGFRLAALTNSSCAGVKAQLENAGIAGLFERQLSVETPGKFKPHRDVYLWAAAQMQVPPSDCMLVAAHAWDVAGAAWAGMRTAYLARTGPQAFPLAPAPDTAAADLEDFANRLCIQKTSQRT